MWLASLEERAATLENREGPAAIIHHELSKLVFFSVFFFFMPCIIATINQYQEYKNMKIDAKN